MKEKSKPASKLNKSSKNKNRKKDMISESNDTKASDSSLFKKNEYSIIFLGAAILTVIIVFIFFRPSEKKESKEVSVPLSSSTSIEARLDKLENLLNDQHGSAANLADQGEKGANETEKKLSLQAYKQRVDRVETAFMVKFDSLSERLDNLEQRISSLNKKLDTAIALAAAPKKVPVKKSTPKKVKKKESIFHTVKKGETLYSISKKYKTTVAKLRKLNNLSADADIYPGNNILVK